MMPAQDPCHPAGRIVRLLGIVAAAEAGTLAAAMGEDVRVLQAGAVAALVQPRDPPLRRLFLRRDRLAQLRQMQQVQARLEQACQAGAFLACDPAAAHGPEPALRAILAADAAALAAALARFGRRHQWDVILRWAPDALLRAAEVEWPAEGAARAAAMRQAMAEERAFRTQALRQALLPRIIAIAEAPPASAEGEAGLTVIIQAGAEALLREALARLPEAAAREASCEWRGPLPALSPAPLRLAPGEAEGEWTLLRLPEPVEPAALIRLWHGLAEALQPPSADATLEPEADAPAETQTAEVA
ncbi:GvpL/GvpF family gas vesicle protein [Falsiroseomonas sp.]|uniref:GvpL/GvpF family gas vesicle protein n=1 Tax=Falsiroseomonas sp. TaxID=2870721 RepID=UPI003F723849